MPTVTEFLSKNVPVLSDLPAAVSESLAKIAQQQIYKSGQTVVFSGTTVEGLHIVASGRVSVEKKPGKGDAHGRKVVTVAELGPGETFGEMSILYENTANATVKVLENDTLIFSIPEAIFRTLMQNFPHVEDNTWRVIFERKLAEKRAVLAAKSAKHSH